MTGSHIRGRLHIRFVAVPFFYDFFKEGIKGMKEKELNNNIITHDKNDNTINCRFDKGGENYG